MLHLVAPVDRFEDYSSSEQYLEPRDVCHDIKNQGALVSGGTHSLLTYVAYNPRVLSWS